MQNTITFVFDNHRVNLAAELAAILFYDALHILSLDARLLPNYREVMIYRNWTRGSEVDDPGRNMYAPPPVTVKEKVSEIVNELYNRAVEDPLGGFPCYNERSGRWKWSMRPPHIANEMNRSHMFDFHVSPVHVEQAQARLK